MHALLWWVLAASCVALCDPAVVQPCVVTTISNPGGSGAYADGVATSARYNLPAGMSWDPSGAAFYIADLGGNRIRRVTLSGFAQTIAGGSSASFADGSGTVATFSGPSGIATDALNVCVGCGLVAETPLPGLLSFHTPLAQALEFQQRLRPRTPHC